MPKLACLLGVWIYTVTLNQAQKLEHFYVFYFSVYVLLRQSRWFHSNVVDKLGGKGD